ncbi:hypothetical protein Bca52824_035129 [Brassica carinata]|uniref:DUF4283 domain-containing protein n=1 Tax=Brassica carinata TaxID=52824 RepID=A0A8X7S2K9_BRACI|nr:hypothetical protein Bca52824_035129 [Brassica carinata]
MNHARSAHMANIKGKGICYENVDEPILLTDQGGAPTIREYRLALIGKILNPKKQTVEKLIQSMPERWGMQDKITANDLGNGKFLLNFSTEEDLKYVLRQGTFHFNFCMFVLVRWEPVVHDDYPWVIPFWVEITRIPLHLWTIRNLEDIGSRLGHIDTVELAAGRMLIEVDTRKPLTFTRRIVSPEGDEASIQIHYEKLFKHCKTCGMVTHEKEYCPQKEVPMQEQGERTGVFARVQLPFSDKIGFAKERYGFVSEGRSDGGFMTDARMAHRRYDNYNNRWTQGGKAKKISTAHSRQSNRYVPYDRKYEKSWRIKERTEKRVDVQERSGETYAHSSPAMNNIEASRYSSVSGDHQTQKSSGKRIASKIVSPLCEASDDNVTKRHKASPCLLTYSPMDEVVPEDAHVIATLEDMEIIGTSKRNEGERDATLESMEQDDDLLGEELLDMEKGGMKVSGGEAGVANMDVERSKPTFVHKSKKRHRLPLGLSIKKAEFLHRGSPILHRSSSKDTYRSESNCLGAGKSSRGNTSKRNEILTKPTRKSKNFKFDKR